MKINERLFVLLVHFLAFPRPDTEVNNTRNEIPVFSYFMGTPTVPCCWYSECICKVQNCTEKCIKRQSRHWCDGVSVRSPPVCRRCSSPVLWREESAAAWPVWSDNNRLDVNSSPRRPPPTTWSFFLHKVGLNFKCISYILCPKKNQTNKNSTWQQLHHFSTADI